jgi:fermentation-respiration switch protein FrsA (DUF1100 family)
MLKLFVVIYLIYATLLFVMQRRMLFAGTERPAASTTPAHGGETLWLEGDFGRVEAWFLPALAGQGRAPAVLFAHGNYELIDDWAEQFAPLRERGIAVMLVEYPGYGRSSGEPTERSVRGAFAAAHAVLAARPEVDATRIVGYGRSLGGAAICTLLSGQRLAALVLQSTFSATAPFAHARGLPGFLMRDQFDNVAALAGYAGPVLVVHGTRDEVIPHAHAERLVKAARRARLLDYAVGHNDCPPDWSAFLAEFERFLEQHALLPVR